MKTSKCCNFEVIKTSVKNKGEGRYFCRKCGYYCTTIEVPESIKVTNDIRAVLFTVNELEILEKAIDLTLEIAQAHINSDGLKALLYKLKQSITYGKNKKE